MLGNPLNKNAYIIVNISKACCKYNYLDDDTNASLFSEADNQYFITGEAEADFVEGTTTIRTATQDRCLSVSIEVCKIKDSIQKSHWLNIYKILECITNPKLYSSISSHNFWLLDSCLLTDFLENPKLFSQYG
jgi:hypothetical protein